MSERPEESLGSPDPAGRRFFNKERLGADAKREAVRGWLAGSLVFLLAIVIIASFAHQWLHPDRSKELHEWMNLVFSPLVALVGAATGFYFGAQSAKKEED